MQSKADAQGKAAEAAPAAPRKKQVARRLRKRSRPAATAAAPAKRQRSAQLPNPERVVVGSRVTFEFGPCWYPGEVRQVVVERTAGGHRQVRVDFDDGDNQKCTLLPGSWEFE